jgi:hypothetical protein
MATTFSGGAVVAVWARTATETIDKAKESMAGRRIT